MDMSKSIARLLRENSQKYLVGEDKDVKKDDDENSQATKSEEKESENKYERVQKLLNNPIFNHAAIVRRLYNENNATYRSLFGKKLDPENTEYSFDDEELSTIISFLMDTSKTINRSVGRKGSA